MKHLYLFILIPVFLIGCKSEESNPELDLETNILSETTESLEFYSNDDETKLWEVQGKMVLANGFTIYPIGSFKDSKPKNIHGLIFEENSTQDKAVIILDENGYPSLSYRDFEGKKHDLLQLMSWVNDSVLTISDLNLDWNNLKAAKIFEALFTIYPYNSTYEKNITLSYNPLNSNFKPDENIARLLYPELTDNSSFRQLSFEEQFSNTLLSDKLINLKALQGWNSDSYNKFGVYDLLILATLAVTIYVFRTEFHEALLKKGINLDGVSFEKLNKEIKSVYDNLGIANSADFSLLTPDEDFQKLYSFDIISGNNQEISADETAQTFKVQYRDQFWRPITNTMVQWKSVHEGKVLQTKATDNNGVAEFTYVANTEREEMKIKAEVLNAKYAKEVEFLLSIKQVDLSGTWEDIVATHSCSNGESAGDWTIVCTFNPSTKIVYFSSPSFFNNSAPYTLDGNNISFSFTREQAHGDQECESGQTKYIEKFFDFNYSGTVGDGVINGSYIIKSYQVPFCKTAFNYNCSAAMRLSRN